MIYKKSQFSIFEIIFLVLLFALSVSYIIFNNNIISKDYGLLLETTADSIYNNENFRDIISNENISSNGFSQDWNSFNNTLNKIFNNFEFKISDSENEEVIFNCSENIGKISTQRIITICNKTNNNFEFRKFTLGVCY